MYEFKCINIISCKLDASIRFQADDLNSPICLDSADVTDDFRLRANRG